MAQFDLYLSFHRVDGAWAGRLKAALGRYGVSVWPARGELRPGDRAPETLAQGRLDEIVT